MAWEHSSREYQCNGEGESGQSRPQSDENLGQLVEDFNNNNSQNVPMTMTNEGGEYYNNLGNNYPVQDDHHYKHYADERVNHLRWEPPVPPLSFPPPQSHLPPMHLESVNKPFIDQPPEYMNAAMMHNTMDHVINQHDQMSRTVSPTPPSEMNLSSPSSPLLYDHRMAVYQDYGSTNGTQMHYSQAQQFQDGPPIHYPTMYR